MPSRLIEECPVPLPTLERAKKLVPPEFLPCYAWFQKNTGESFSRLPHRMEAPPATPIPLSRDSGIYIPSVTRVEYDGGRKYALSVHSTGISKYADRRPIALADGTWILDYAAHEGPDSQQGYNQALLNCLSDGVPVGVMFKERADYRILGLAFVERFNQTTRMFTLHGPVTPANETLGAFALPGLDELATQQKGLFVEYSTADERLFTTVQKVRREQQGRFRDELLCAYSGACAISSVRVPEVLQAAHINPYRGRKSQVVNNGLLLRADLHLLYDAHLISVEPDSLNISLSDRLAKSDYIRYQGCRLRTPLDETLSPSRDLLAMHYEQFRQENQILVA